jgi:hypothetical protein
MTKDAPRSLLCNDGKRMIYMYKRMNRARTNVLYFSFNLCIHYPRFELLHKLDRLFRERKCENLSLVSTPLHHLHIIL